MARVFLPSDSAQPLRSTGAITSLTLDLEARLVLLELRAADVAP